MKFFLQDGIPDGFLDCPLDELGDLLPEGPTLLRIAGQAEPPLFVATLLHGNEPTGLLALQRLLKSYVETGKPLPRSLFLFIGNPEAARSQLRRLSDQPDFNRIWDGGDLPEHRMAEELLHLLNENGLFASIDIHNTSGKNPHYGCFNKLDSDCVHLAAMFSRNLIYFTRPKGVLSSALAEICPSITIESGTPEDPFGPPHVREFIDRCLHLESIVSAERHALPFEVYHSIARILVQPESRIAFGGNRVDLDFRFPEDIEDNNFTEMPANSLLGWRLDAEKKLWVIDEAGQEVGEEFLLYDNEEIRLRRAVVPSMLTQNEEIVHQDCLGYLMERYALPSELLAKRQPV